MKIQNQFKSIWKQSKEQKPSNSSQNFAYFVWLKEFQIGPIVPFKGCPPCPH
jgi:hypothetical protein